MQIGEKETNQLINNIPYIAVENLTKYYESSQGKVLALDNISLTVGNGRFVSIVGPSGCGKSTLLKIISGLIPSTSGRIAVCNETVTSAITDVGIVFQNDVLLPWRNVIDNIMLQAEVRHLNKQQQYDSAMELLDLVGLKGFEKNYPAQLSGGMRQRVSICRALVHDPPLLLMDEPFSALDALTRDQMNLDLQNVWQKSKKTAMFITHSISDAIFLSDIVYVMSPRPGRVIEKIAIDLPRPRRLSVRETNEFGQYMKHIRGIFESTGVLREG